MDQYTRVEAFLPEKFNYIYLSQIRDDKEVVFNWRRGKLFDFEAAFVLYEMVVDDPEATVTKVMSKVASKWSVSSCHLRPFDGRLTDSLSLIL